MVAALDERLATVRARMLQDVALASAATDVGMPTASTPAATSDSGAAAGTETGSRTDAVSV